MRLNNKCNSYYKLLQGYGQVVSITLTERFNICGQGMKRKRWTEQLSIGNDKVVELKLIKHDEALKDLTGLLKKLNAMIIITT